MAGRTLTWQRLALAAAVVAVLACAATGPAVAAGEPQIVAAGIDPTDRFVVTWRLEPDTTFGFLEFSSVPILSPFVPGSFAGRNVVGSVCAPPPAQSCPAPLSLSAFRAPDPVSRDRRYFVRVNARKAGRTRPLSSGIWVIDESKPQLTGGGRPAAAPTNTAVLGLPYVPPGRQTIPAPRLTLLKPPRTIAAVLRNGVGAQVRCPAVVCYVVVALKLGKTTLVFTDATARADARQRVVLRPRPAGRARLMRRTRARLDVVAEVRQPGGKRTQISRSLRVRR
jgi:hypothetical protein